MNATLIDLLCDPLTRRPLRLQSEERDPDGRIRSGILAADDGRTYRIRNGIPRFVESSTDLATVASFGDEWNYFNFTQFRENWLRHTVANTFGSTDAFRNKVIVDAGAGSGAQALWMLQSGAAHVILLELSHAVDGIILQNLNASGFTNWDIIQCSIDAPPLRDGSIDGIVICHNVIQHTRSVEETARALFRLVAPHGEFVFNCYPKNDQGVLRWARFHLIYTPLRAVLSRVPFSMNLWYARAMGGLRLIPGIGTLLEKLGFCVQGDVVARPGEASHVRQRYRATVLNTFDCFGSHQYQHLKTDTELRMLVQELQPDPARILNMDRYFLRPAPIGCALRLRR
jgi:uncharacterized protein YbaR (Trm112 family)/ubiquinone/menaquinone biosynthesis C-methylase UbiE